jgi:lipoate-protein ligase A
VARVVPRRGTVAELHALDPFRDGAPDEPAVWSCEPTDAAVVLGSRQRPELLDAAACARSGLSIVRRRSGGGMVVVRPESMCWLDVVVPHGVAPDDVRGSMVWAGERWLDALTPLLDTTEAVVHRGGLVCTPWSDLVCFAGTGPGEVLLAGAKLVGLSQRRTRHGLRIQGLVHRAPTVDDVAGLISAPRPDAPLPPPARLAALDVAHLASRLAERLTRD